MVLCRLFGGELGRKSLLLYRWDSTTEKEQEGKKLGTKESVKLRLTLSMRSIAADHQQVFSRWGD